MTGAHCVSAAVAGWRHRRSRPKPAGAVPASITIVRPLKGVDATTERCLESSFQLSWNDVDVIFCVASADDPVVPLVQRLMGRHPAVASRLLVGNDLVSDNPKLNNMIKAWPGARGDWIVFVDANVDLPCDAVERILAVDAPHVGLISSPPRAMAPSGADALIECAILNSYQGRWQSFADAIGYGFAQGKVLAFKRHVLERAGGLEGLGREPAEDAAATRLIRSMGLHVRLVDCFFDQPVGQRTLRDVWLRQARWASLRRATFPIQFAAEILSYPWLAVGLAALSFDDLEIQAAAALAVLMIWYSAEAACGAMAQWPERTRHRLARDLMMPFVWCRGWLRSSFEWHGQKMRAERSPDVTSAA